MPPSTLASAIFYQIPHYQLSSNTCIITRLHVYAFVVRNLLLHELLLHVSCLQVVFLIQHKLLCQPVNHHPPMPILKHYLSHLYHYLHIELSPYRSFYPGI